jgi:acetyl-CoA C-acetyltransferase
LVCALKILVLINVVLNTAVMLGAQSIMLGINQVVCVGGMESMSNAPFFLPASTSLKTLGHLQLKSSMLYDGLWDPTKDMSMGSCAELCAEEMKISRGAQVWSAIKVISYIH